MKIPDKIIIHCSNTPDHEWGIGYKDIHHLHTAPKSTAIDWYGIKTFGRGWSDIGYHWVITREGDVQAGRDERIMGAHCKGHNDGSIGICLIGTLRYSETQIEQFFGHLINTMYVHRLVPEQVYCHNEFTIHKTCPNIPGAVIRHYLRLRAGHGRIYDN